MLAELAESAVIVHDRYQNYDSAQLGTLVHQLCCAHLLRDVDDAAQVYPDAVWPVQIADALRGLIHQANLARERGLPAIADDIRNELITRFRHGVLVGLSDTSHGSRPGERKARLLLQVLRDRQADVLRFAHDLKVPPTSNQAERDLRPSKVQQNISGRLTSEERTRDRYTIRGYVSTAAKHGLNMITVYATRSSVGPGCPIFPYQPDAPRAQTPTGRHSADRRSSMILLPLNAYDAGPPGGASGGEAERSAPDLAAPGQPTGAGVRSSS